MSGATIVHSNGKAIIDQLRKDRDELAERLEEVSTRLSRRIAHEKHHECVNCEADKELILISAALLTRVKEGR